MFGGFFQASCAFLIHAVIAKLECVDEGAVDNQIRIAPNRGREMRIMRQVQSEMPALIRAIDGLGLAPQNRHANGFGQVFLYRLAEQHIEPRGCHSLAE